MIKVLFGLTIVMGSLLAQATPEPQQTSMRTCNDINFAPRSLNCNKDFVVTYRDPVSFLPKKSITSYNYAIKIQSKCEVTSIIETASVVVSKDGLKVVTLELQNGSFSTVTDDKNEVSFKSQVIGLDLTECQMPVNGGFSFGNKPQ